MEDPWVVRRLCVGFSSATRLARFQEGNVEVRFYDRAGVLVLCVTLPALALRTVDLYLDLWRRKEHEDRLLTMNGGRLSTTLMQAAEAGGVRDVTFLIAHGAAVPYSLERWGPGGLQRAIADALGCAARNGHEPVAAALLQSGTSLGTDREWAVRSALVTAAAVGHLSVVALLLPHTAGTSLASESTLRNGHSDVVTLLATHVLSTSQLSDEQAFELVIQLNQTHMVEQMLDRGADVDAGHGQHLLYAASKGFTDTVRLLLDRGAPLHPHQEPLLEACMKGHVDVVRILLDHGADVHFNNDRPLFNASWNGHLELVRLLLDRGADVHANRNAALRTSRSHKHAAIEALLFERGANLAACDEYVPYVA